MDDFEGHRSLAALQTYYYFHNNEVIKSLVPTLMEKYTEKQTAMMLMGWLPKKTPQGSKFTLINVLAAVKAINSQVAP